MRSKYRQILEASLYPSILVLVAMTALAPCLLGGKVPMSVDYIYSLPPWSGQGSQDVSPAMAEASRLQALQYYPWYAFLSRSISAGDSLLWNPLEGCGVPFMAVWKTRVFSPFTLPFYVLPLTTALKLSALLKLCVAGFCAFFTARRFGMVAPFALATGIVYQLSGHVLGQLDTPMSDVMPWLPLLFLFAEQLVAGHWALWPFGCLTWTLMLFGGDPATACLGAVAALVYYFTRASLGRLHPAALGGGFVVFGMSLAVGGAMASIQILPYIELIYESVSVGLEPLRASLSWVALLSLLFGSASAGSSVAGSSMYFIGFLPVVFVPIWAMARRFDAAQHRLRIDAMFLSAALLSACGLVVLALPDDLPMLRALRIEHFLLANTLSLGLLSAAAAQCWLLLTAPQVTQILPRLLLLLGLAFMALVVLLTVAGFAGSGEAVPTWTSLVIEFLMWMSVVVLLGITLVKPSPELLGWGMAALSIVGAFLLSPVSVSCSEPSRLFPMTPAMEALTQTGQRVAGAPSLSDWPLSGNGIAQFYSSSGILLKRQHLFASQLEGGKPLLIRKIGSSWLVLAGEDTLGPFSGMRPALKRQTAFKGGVALFEDMESQPAAKVWYVGRMSPAVDAGLLDPNLPPLMETSVAPAQPAGDAATVSLSSPRSNVYERYAVNSQRPGVLVMAQAWYPGWKVRVDGEEKELFPVDVMFRGVAVSAGDHAVEVYYDPVTVELGMGISTTATLIACVGLLLPVISRFRQAPST